MAAPEYTDVLLNDGDCGPSTELVGGIGKEFQDAFGSFLLEELVIGV